MEHVVIQDPDAGEVWCWKYTGWTLSASSVGAYMSGDNGRTMIRLDHKGDHGGSPPCIFCIAYRKHLELRDAE